MKKHLFKLILVMLLIYPLAACGGSIPETTPTDAPSEKATEQPTEAPEPTDFDDNGNIILSGRSNYVIVTGAKAAISEQTAAKQLQAYIKKISGVTLDIVKDSTEEREKEIVVGKTNRERLGEFNRLELGDEGFVIKTRDNKVFIVGGEVRGTLYGVYTYLEEHLGCRFYTANFERVPKHDTIPFVEIAENKQIPVFESRSPGWNDFSDQTISVKLKINGSHSRGKIDDVWGSNLYWAGSTVHTLPKLAGLGSQWQNEPCLSNEETYVTVLASVREILAANPGAKYISVSQGDSSTEDCSCKCSKCTRMYEETGSRAGMYITFVNRIAEAIKDEYPDIMVHTLAYKYTKEPPINVKPADNVMVQFCTIETCFRHSICDCTTRGADFEEMLKGWANICNYLAVWDYTTNFRYYNISFPNFEAIYDNIQLFANNNVKYLYEQGQWQGTSGEFSELRGYLLARLLWDPYMSKEKYYAYMDEFLYDYYGEGASKIREYIDLMLKVTEDVCMGVYDVPTDFFKNTITQVRNADAALPNQITADDLDNYKTFDWSPYYEWYTAHTPNELITRGEKLFEEAYALAETQEQKMHVEKSSIQVVLLKSYFEYDRISIIEENIRQLAFNLSKNLTQSSDAMCTSMAMMISAHVTKQLKDDYAELNKHYYDLMVKHGVIYEREGTKIRTDGNYDFTLKPRDWKHQ